MRLTESISRFCVRQPKNLVKRMLGKPLTYPSLVSATLDRDDVDLARQWIVRPSDWDKTEVVRQYEAAFAQWNGSKYAFAFMGGRVALSACIYALNLKAGDEVVIPGYTCVVVPNAFEYAGVRPVYADIELETYGLDIKDVQTKTTSKTKAILLHHLYGLVCRDYQAILDYAKANNIYVIEDCAHSTGAVWRNKKVGNQGDMGFYSSEQSKVFTTIQGGIAVTNNDKLAGRLSEYYQKAPLPEKDFIESLLYNVMLNYYQFKHPRRWFWSDLAEIRYGRYRLISTSYQEECGECPAIYGRRMPAPVAALGINQLNKIDGYNERRRVAAQRWDQWCRQRRIQKPVVVSDSVPVFLRYPILVEPHRKQDRAWALKDAGVDPGVWFITNIHPARRTVDGCPNSDKAVSGCINFPTLL